MYFVCHLSRMLYSVISIWFNRSFFPKHEQDSIFPSSRAVFTMHNSLNIFAQRISKLSVRSSLQTDTTPPANEASSKPLPSIPYEASGTRFDRSVISLPVPGNFVDLCKSEGSAREVHTNHSTTRNKRKQSEMPLSSHPPFQQSWIEIQPLRTHTVESRTDHEPNLHNNSINVPRPVGNGVEKEPPRVTPSRPYNGILLPSPPQPPSAPPSRPSERRRRPYSKSPRARFPVTTPINHFEQPIAPLTPRHLEDDTACTYTPPRSSGAGMVPEQYTSVDNPNRNSIPLPATLRDRWAKRKSSRVILADTSLQLKVFSELGVELDEVLSLYTPRKMS